MDPDSKVASLNTSNNKLVPEEGAKTIVEAIKVIQL
jgi:hypothetical protein